MKNKNKITLWKYFKKHKLSLAIYLLCCITGLALATYTSFYTADLLLDVTQSNFDSAILRCFVILGMMIVLQVLNSLEAVIYQKKICTPIINEMRYELAKNLLKYDSSVYASSTVGGLSAKIVNEPTSFIMKFDWLVAKSMTIIMCSIIMLYMAISSIWIGVFLVIAFLVSFSFRIFANKKQDKYDNAEKDSAEKLQSLVTEIVRSEKDAKALNIDKVLYDKLGETITIATKKSEKSCIFADVYEFITELINEVTSLGCIILGIVLTNQGIIAYGLLIYLLTNRSKINTFFGAFLRAMSVKQQMRNSRNRINKLLDTDIYKHETFGDKELQEMHGNIEFKDVDFAYQNINLNTGKQEQGKKVLDNISFKIEANTTVAFVGRSGSGKTTILSLIDKIYDADSGSIYLEGENIQSLTKDSIRNNISMVNQFPYIFDATIRQNLLNVKPDATEQEIKDVCVKSDLMEVINGFKDGLDTRVGESGVKLSGGQRQRLAIARALLKNSRIILLDESTSSLDNFAQANIQKSLENIKGEKTIVIVAHRLSTIKTADVIFFIKEGKIQNSGTFDYLYENDEEFKRLFFTEVVD